jgi:hypothetical protein
LRCITGNIKRLAAGHAHVDQRLPSMPSCLASTPGSVLAAGGRASELL